MQHMKQTRVNRELEKITRAPPRGITVYRRHDENSIILDALIAGPEGTPYKNGTFKLEIMIPEQYPFDPPSIKFITKVYHPNIDDNGRICLDLLKLPPKGTWRPTMGIEGLLVAIRTLLECPNPDDPLMADIAQECKNWNAEFVRKAQLYTEMYAC